MQHEQRVERVEQADDTAIATSQRRQGQIDRLNRTLAEQQRFQQRVNQGIAQYSTSAERAASSSAEAASSGGLFSGMLEGLATRVASVVSGLIGVGGLLTALQLIRQEMEENARAARKFAEDSLDLQFLSPTFNEQERKFVGRAAIFAGRKPSETALAFGGLKSFFPGASDRELQTLFMEVAETARTTPTSLSVLTKAFTGIYAETRNAQKAQNILRETITQAGSSDPAVISGLLGKFFGPGIQIGHLKPGEAAGAVAAVTGLTTQQPEEQVQGLLTFMLQVMGKGSPEASKILEREKIDRSDFFKAIEQIGTAVNEGRISSSEFETVASREGIKVASALIDPTKRREFFGKINAVQTTAASNRDITREAIQAQFGADRLQALNFAAKQAEAEEAMLETQDQNSQELLLAQQILQNELRKRGVGPVRRFLAERFQETAQFAGSDAESSTWWSFLGSLKPDEGPGGFDEAINATNERMKQLRETGMMQQPNTTTNHNTTHHTTIIGTQINNANDPETAGLESDR